MSTPKTTAKKAPAKRAKNEGRRGPRKGQGGRPVGSVTSDKTERLNDRLIKGTLALIDAAAKAAGKSRAEIILERFS